MRQVRAASIFVGCAITALAGVASGEAANTFELAGPPVDFVYVENVAGQAQYRATETEAWQTIRAGDTLPMGVMVRTGLRSEVKGVLPDGTKLAVAALTRSTLEVTSATSHDASIRSSLVLDYGDLDTRMLVVRSNSLGVVVPQPTVGVQQLVPPTRGGRDDRFGLPLSGKPTR